MGNQFLNEEEEKRLGEIVRTALRVKPSVPSRGTCPAPEVIRSLAFHSGLDTATVKKVTLHIAECYECARLAGQYAREYRKERKKGAIQPDDMP